MPVLEVKNLAVTFQTYAGTIYAVNGISFTAEKNETLVIVGESGCGKTAAANAIVRLLPGKKTKICAGSEIIFEGKNILEYTETEMEKLRGDKIAMIFQDPLSYLNPTMTVGKQIMESLLIHKKGSKKEALEKTLRILEMAQIQNPEKRLKQYPHEFSGGMRQRVMIAMAMSCKPSVLIADEPTTALDVTIQAQILDLIKNLQEQQRNKLCISASLPVTPTANEGNSTEALSLITLATPF